MQQCANHVEYQLLNKHTRVGYLLEGIVYLDAGLQAAMASIWTDDGADGMWNIFEAAAVHILPYSPGSQEEGCCWLQMHGRTNFVD